MKYQVLFFLSTISFLSYSSQACSGSSTCSVVIANKYVSKELQRFRVGMNKGLSPLDQCNDLGGGFKVIINTPMDKEGYKKSFALMKRAEYENRSFEDVVEWSKEYCDSRADR